MELCEMRDSGAKQIRSWRMLIRSICRILMKIPIWFFLKKKNISYKTLPLFYGRWPQFINKGRIALGEGCVFREFRTKLHFAVLSKEAKLEIGSHCFFNNGVNICAKQRIRIGDGCKLADDVTIYDTNFHQIQEGEDVFQKEVVLGKNVWVGARAIIMPGVEIGEHSVIGAGSVVTHSIPPRVVAAGNPARVIKNIKCDDLWIRQ